MNDKYKDVERCCGDIKHDFTYMDFLIFNYYCAISIAVENKKSCNLVIYRTI